MPQALVSCGTDSDKNEYDNLTQKVFTNLEVAMKCASALPIDLQNMLKEVYKVLKIDKNLSTLANY